MSADATPSPQSQPAPTAPAAPAPQPAPAVPAPPPPPSWKPLSPLDRRILGVLVEKQKTSKTADAYPLTLNALVTGCNQKSNRDPILELDEVEVEEAVEALQPRGLVSRITGGRVDRFRHELYTTWTNAGPELAVLAELLLRGPQTKGDLRVRAARMAPIDSLEAARRRTQAAPGAAVGGVPDGGGSARRGGLARVPRPRRTRTTQSASRGRALGALRIRRARRALVHPEPRWKPSWRRAGRNRSSQDSRLGGAGNAVDRRSEATGSAHRRLTRRYTSWLANMNEEEWLNGTDPLALLDCAPPAAHARKHRAADAPVPHVPARVRAGTACGPGCRVCAALVELAERYADALPEDAFPEKVALIAARLMNSAGELADLNDAATDLGEYLCASGECFRLAVARPDLLLETWVGAGWLPSCTCRSRPTRRISV